MFAPRRFEVGVYGPFEAAGLPETATGFVILMYNADDWPLVKLPEGHWESIATLIVEAKVGRLWLEEARMTLAGPFCERDWGEPSGVRSVNYAHWRVTGLRATEHAVKLLMHKPATLGLRFEPLCP